MRSSAIGFMRFESIAICAAVFGVVAGGEASGGPGGDAYFGYGHAYRRVDMPPVGQGSFNVVGDALPDGRLVAATGTSLFIESGVGTGSFALAASIDSSIVGGSTDPAFLSISPDGAHIALGAGFAKPVLVFNSALLNAGAPGAVNSSSASVFNVGHYAGAWRDNSSLALTAGAFGSPAVVTLLDTSSSPAAPVNPTIISNIGGASTGIAFDGAGRLYTGNGFDSFAGGSDTGWIKAFEPASWSGGAADFEIGGVHIATLLSSDGLDFDAEGNLFVGGGNFGSGDFGTLGVVHSSAIGAALGGGGVIDNLDPLSVRRLDPRGDGFGFFGSVFNAHTGELLVTDGATWYATIPAPGGAVVIGAAMAVCGRRRHAIR